MARRDITAKQWQRRAARRKKGSKNQKKAYRKATRYQQYEKNVRQDYAHQTSHALVVHDDYDLYVFEALAIPNMAKHPKAKTDAQGPFLPNKATAKAGLNRAILSSAWGQVVSFTTYKALRHGKLAITVPPRIVRKNVPSAHSLPRKVLAHFAWTID